MRGARTRRARHLRAALTEQVPRDHRDLDEVFARRRRAVAGVSLAGAALLGVSFTRRAGSPQFYAATLGVAATWILGGLAAGPLHLGRIRAQDGTLRRPVLVPVLLGGVAFGGFYGCALVVRHVPLVDDGVRSVLRLADEGSSPLVLLTALANGVGEEVFFRGALYAAAGDNHPVAVSTGVYTLVTVTTRNPALVVAAALMGTLFGLQRRASGGIEAPLLTHVTWTILMLRYLPPLFRDRER